WTGIHPSALDPAGWGWLALLALTGQVLTWLLVGAALPRLAPSTGAAVLVLPPVLAVGVGALFLSEYPSAMQIAGCLLVVLAVWATERAARSSPGGPGAAAPPGRAGGAAAPRSSEIEGEPPARRSEAGSREPRSMSVTCSGIRGSRARSTPAVLPPRAASYSSRVRPTTWTKRTRPSRPRQDPVKGSGNTRPGTCGNTKEGTLADPLFERMSGGDLLSHLAPWRQYHRRWEA